MTSIEPPAEGVPTPPAITKTAEGGGVVLTCECGWARWFASDATASGYGPQHIQKCKGKREISPTVKPKRSASDWSGREGSTWIDKL